MAHELRTPLANLLAEIEAKRGAIAEAPHFMTANSLDIEVPTAQPTKKPPYSRELLGFRYFPAVAGLLTINRLQVRLVPRGWQ